MREMLALGALAIAAMAAGGASAAPSVEIRQAVARVTIMPEARSDVVVEVIRANPRLPLRIAREGDRVVVDGGLGMRLRGCGSFLGRPRAMVWGIGAVGFGDMPQIIVHTPADVHVSASGAVFGSVGRAASVELNNSGCGDWTVADVAQALRVGVSGSGDIRTGAAGTADLRVSGSGDIFVRRVESGLNAATSGSGDIQTGLVNGPLRVRVAGSGNVRARGGQVTDMNVSVAGSGDVTFNGVARTLSASVAGSGDVTVSRVTGAVSKQVAGSGDIRVGT
ncbi:MAG: DUF2807 domain-containing protein [Pseudomonadota bacterium]|nr:DUF2807 domain-containing protein [Pseudomonadota bacterium]